MIINPPKDNITRTCNGIRKYQSHLTKNVESTMSYTKQVSHPTKKIRKKKFIMSSVKQHLSSDKVSVFADKTFNIFKLDTDEYEKLENHLYLNDLFK